MGSQDAQHPGNSEETMNWADYADALSRNPELIPVTQQKIRGRRLRDQYVEETILMHGEPNTA